MEHESVQRQVTPLWPVAFPLLLTLVYVQVTWASRRTKCAKYAILRCLREQGQLGSNRTWKSGAQRPRSASSKITQKVCACFSCFCMPATSCCTFVPQATRAGRHSRQGALHTRLAEKVRQVALSGRAGATPARSGPAGSGETVPRYAGLSLLYALHMVTVMCMCLCRHTPWYAPRTGVQRPWQSSLSV